MALQGERRCCDEGILIDGGAGFSTVREWGNNWSKFDDVIEVMLGMLRCPTYQLPTRPGSTCLDAISINCYLAAAFITSAITL